MHPRLHYCVVGAMQSQIKKYRCWGRSNSSTTTKSLQTIDQCILRAVESAEWTVEWIVEEFQDAESGAWAAVGAGCSRSRRWTMPCRRSSRWARKMMLEGDAVEFSADRTDCVNKDLWFACTDLHSGAFQSLRCYNIQMQMQTHEKCFAKLNVVFNCCC